MILSNTDILAILKGRPNKDMVKAAQDYSKKLVMHMTGKDLDSYLALMEKFEKPELLAVRRRYARSNKDLFSRLHRPIDKVFNARGGSTYYNLPEAKEKELRQTISEVEYGYSLRKWLERFWLNAYHYDPMGLIFIEVDKTGDAYPTWKSINEVYDYSNNGRKLDYVVFDVDAKKVSKEHQKDGRRFYRVVDDAFDRIVAWDSENAVTEIQELTYLNYFQSVPARIVSDIFDQIKGMYISPDDAVVELADTFLMEGSVFSVWKKLFGFPQRWQYAGVCDTCKGSKVYEGKQCNTCNGTGHKSRYDVSESITIAPPTGQDPIIAPDIAGYIQPAIEGWDKMGTSITDLENLMHYTKWGVDAKVQVNSTGVNPEAPTATEIQYDNAPLDEALNKYSEAAESIEKWIVDQIASFKFGSYKGADINYGRKYITDTPNAIWERYQKARSGGAPDTTLNALLEDYYHSKYCNDSMELEKFLKLMKVEPWVHLSVIQAKTLVTDFNEYNKKLYYGEWVSTLKTAYIVTTEVETLRNDLTAYVAAKGLKEPELQERKIAA